LSLKNSGIGGRGKLEKNMTICLSLKISYAISKIIKGIFCMTRYKIALLYFVAFASKGKSKKITIFF